MKKWFLIILAIIVLGALGYFIYTNFSGKLTSYIQISYEEFEEKVNSDEKFVLFIGSESCSHCQTYKGTLNRVVKDYNVEIYYIDISSLTNEQFAYLNSHFPFTGTPTTIVIENGKEYERHSCRIDGAKSYDYTIARLKKAGIL